MIAKTDKNKAFTLIELLVVISVIGVLAALAIFGMQNSFQNARNTQRKSDLSQFRNSLEIYANKNNGFYPAKYWLVRPYASESTGLCGWLGLTNCPQDPNYVVDVGPYYKYKTTDGGNTDGTPTATGYIMWADLEGSSTQFWVVCSNGKSGVSSTIPTELPVSSSVCD